MVGLHPVDVEVGRANIGRAHSRRRAVEVKTMIGIRIGQTNLDIKAPVLVGQIGHGKEIGGRQFVIADQPLDGLVVGTKDLIAVALVVAMLG